MSIWRNKLVFTCMALLLTVGLLAGCGGGSGNNGGGNNEGAAAATTEATDAPSSNGNQADAPATSADPVDLRLDVVTTGAQSVPTYVISKLGLDKKYGFNLITHDNSGAYGANWTALKAGEVDAIITNWLDIARNQAQGTMVYGVVPFLRWNNGLLVPKDSPVKSIQDMVGLKVGVFNTKSLDWVLVRAAVAKLGGEDPSKSNTISEGAPGLLTGLLQQKKVDAIYSYGDVNTQLEGSGEYQVTFTTADMLNYLGLDNKAPYLFYGFTDAFIQAHPDTVKGFAAAYKEAIEYLNANDDIWKEIGESKFDMKNDLAITVLARTMRSFIASEYDPSMDASARALFDFLKQNGNEDLLAVSDLPEKLFWTGE